MPSKLDATWHRAHPMPPRPTLAERIAWHSEHARHCGCRPMPPALLALVEQARAAGGGPLRELLSGGDRRSIARSAEARAIVEADPRRVGELAELAGDEDALVAMRAVDLLEKLAHAHTDWVEPHKRLFVGPLADSDMWEVRLQVVRALPLFRWTKRERERAVAILVRDVDHPRAFVRAWALDSLAAFAARDASLAPVVEAALVRFEGSGQRALATRARHIRARLAASA